jgi:hypothetical protein
MSSIQTRACLLWTLFAAALFTEALWAGSIVYVVRSTPAFELKDGDSEAFRKVSLSLRRLAKEVSRQSRTRVRVQEVLVENYERVDELVDPPASLADEAIGVVFLGHANETEFVPNRYRRFTGESFAPALSELLRLLVPRPSEKGFFVYFHACHTAESPQGPSFLDALAEKLKRTLEPVLFSDLLLVGHVDDAHMENRLDLEDEMNRLAVSPEIALLKPEAREKKRFSNKVRLALKTAPFLTLPLVTSQIEGIPVVVPIVSVFLSGVLYLYSRLNDKLKWQTDHWAHFSLGFTRRLFRHRFVRLLPVFGDAPKGRLWTLDITALGGLFKGGPREAVRCAILLDAG